MELTLNDYTSMTSDLPRPTAAQIEDFAKFVPHAHSWYKHLPLLPPVAPFSFFLDPSAGMQHALASDGALHVFDRDKHGFHYSWIPTRDYRRRFGYLAFCISAGTSVSLVTAEGDQLVPSDEAPLVYDPERKQLCHLPREVLQAGTARVSGLVHTAASTKWAWSRQTELFRGQHRPGWPAESGGAAVLRRILDRCRLLEKDPSQEENLPLDDPRLRDNFHLGGVDYPLHVLIAPERRRQRHEMVQARSHAVPPDLKLRREIADHHHLWIQNEALCELFDRLCDEGGR